MCIIFIMEILLWIIHTVMFMYIKKKKKWTIVNKEMLFYQVSTQT